MISKESTKRWPLNAFALDTMRTNSKRILSNCKVKLINFALPMNWGIL